MWFWITSKYFWTKLHTIQGPTILAAINPTSNSNSIECMMKDINEGAEHYRIIKHRSARPEQDYHHCLLQVSLVIMPSGQTNNNWSNKILDDECDHAHHNHSQLGDETTFTFKVWTKIIASSKILLKSCHFFIEFLHVRYQVCQCRHRKF